MNLKVEMPTVYDGRFPSYSQPREIGYFSLDSDRNYVNDKHQLKYLVLPQRLSDLFMDLNKGYSTAIKKDFCLVEKIDTLLKWIITHQEEVRKNFADHSNTSSLKMNFVCFRGLLTAICGTIYENKDDWLICATKFRSVIYLCAFDTEQSCRRREKMTERENLMCSWGYKFEQYMTSDKMNSRPNTSVPVNEKEEFCSVMKGKLGNHSILFGAEVDGEDPAYYNTPGHDPTSMQRYIELKTSRIISNERQNQNFCRYKLIKWWLQSFLAGISQVICGFRDDDGIVRNLHIFNVKDLPKMAKDLWSASACFNFCFHFLNYVKECVIKDDPYSKIDFVFFRGLLTYVGSTIYEKSEDWQIYATKFKSVIYLCVVKTANKEQVEEDLGERGVRMCTWGFKFEQYMTTDTLNSRPDTSVPVNENEKYYSAMKCKLGSHRILLLSEVDGVDPEHLEAHGNDPASVLRYIELKTSRIITSGRQHRNFLRYKLIKWYLQSYFAGVPRVLCGFRDDDGIVRKVTNYNVRDMPSLAEGLWHAPSCINFCSHFLNHVKNCGMIDDPRVVYEIYWEPGSDIIIENMSTERPEYQLLPDWYIERVEVI